MMRLLIALLCYMGLADIAFAEAVLTYREGSQ